MPGSYTNLNSRETTSWPRVQIHKRIPHLDPLIGGSAHHQRNQQQQAGEPNHIHRFSSVSNDFKLYFLINARLVPLPASQFFT